MWLRAANGREGSLVSFPAFELDLVSRVSLIALCAICITLAAPLAAGAVLAQSVPGERDRVHFVGDHDIQIFPTNLNLAAGSAHFSVVVTDPETGNPVPDARVVLVASHSEEGDPGWAIATNTPVDPQLYNVHLKLDSTGMWVISVDVSSTLGADLVEVTTLEVPSFNRLTQGSWVFFGVFLAIVGGIAYVWLTARRNYRRRQASQARPQ